MGRNRSQKRGRLVEKLTQTVTVEEEGEQIGGGATGTRATFVLKQIRCARVLMLWLEAECRSSYLWALIPVLANSYKK